MPQAIQIETQAEQQGFGNAEHQLRALQGDATKMQESGFGHRASCPGSRQQTQGAGHLEFSPS
jgi:hypothetical protein